jgi:membrane carboxypeptidase/penicillin-binding protein
MVRAYSIFLNKGRMIEPIFLKRIEDKFGNVLFEQERTAVKEVMDPHHALVMTEMMKGVVDKGTASSLRTVYGFDNEIAGKTGTTQHNTDGWFIGFTPVLITGVWVGGDHPRVRFRYGGYGQGAASALPIWARYMQKIYRDPLYRYSRQLAFPIPDEVKEGVGVRRLPGFSQGSARRENREKVQKGAGAVENAEITHKSLSSRPVHDPPDGMLENTERGLYFYRNSGTLARSVRADKESMKLQT